jgi:hypothetical protein
MGSPEFDQAAIDLGHEVRRINWREFLGRRFATSAPTLQSPIMHKAREFKPDLVFVQTHQNDVVMPSTYAALRNGGAFVVNWCGDVREPLPECYRRYAEHVDVMAFSNLTDVATLKSEILRSRYLQIGYDPSIYHPGDGTQQRSGIVFMANHYEGRFPNSNLRKEIALRLMREFQGEFMLYGSGWAMRGVRPTVDGHEEADIYRRSLIAVNVDHFHRPGFFSDRLLRAMACGCHVIDAYRCTDPDPNDFVEAVRSALASKNLASSGRKNAQWAAEHHTWKNRIMTMENWVKAIEDDGRIGPILADA